MEEFEDVAPSREAYQPTYYFHYVDDTFVNWLHGPEDVNDFLNHLNNILLYIQFTFETESNRHLSFLEIDTYGRQDSSLWHNVYRKPTSINLFLNSELHHHLTNKHSVLSTLVHKATAICDQESHPEELGFFRVHSNRAATVRGRFFCSQSTSYRTYT